ncbi:MAG: hypothetical protein M1827_000103 [Pycnora praestabilis]|nr:MAG: hypothetical protein M1827_000103 [Pycnora praestabilis]
MAAITCLPLDLQIRVQRLSRAVAPPKQDTPRQASQALIDIIPPSAESQLLPSISSKVSIVKIIESLKSSALEKNLPQTQSFPRQIRMSAPQQGAPATGGQQDDYVDKGVSAAEKKFGLPDNKGTNEKVTDKARGMFEKATGKNVPDKVSN